MHPDPTIARLPAANAGERLPGTPLPMHYWEGARGVRLAGDSWGDASAVSVVLQHGGGQTRHAWKRTGEVLGAAGYRAIAFDARGHGDSDWAADGDYSQDLMVQDLQCVLAQEGAVRPVLVGASMGGGTSLVAAGERRVDAAALVLVDIAPRAEAGGVQNIMAFMRRNPDGFASLEEVADAIASYQPHRERPRHLQGLAKNVRLAADGRYRWHWDPRFLEGDHDMARRQARLEACASALSMPSLLVRGGMSDVLTEEGVREFLALAPASEYVAIGAASHMVAGDRNDSFGAAVVEFLMRVVPAAGPPLADAEREALVHRLDRSNLRDLP
ncbi:alpha/beta hydrolase [Variovorax sp. dw_954]|uniref:alpha/beta fold hydrolase n=1 Tax=Variovorax sp. dw_954 TaxID=2720078 RepID=UPI001BD2515A|nr:alpha/beta hydrolase [Variovorax sp. dw_954]